MNREQVRSLLERFRRGEVDTDEALESLARLPFVDVPGARVDTHRALRNGLPEVVYAPGKQSVQIVEIVRTLRAAGQDVLVTRVAPHVSEEVLAGLGGGEAFLDREGVADGVTRAPEAQDLQVRRDGGRDHAAEARQRPHRLGGGHTQRIERGERSQRVLHVEATVQRHARPQRVGAFAAQLERGALGPRLEAGRPPRRSPRLSDAVAHDPARRLLHHVAHVRVVHGRHDRSIRRHARHQRAEGFLHVVEIARVMSTPPIVIEPEATIDVAALIMAEKKIGCLPVLDKDRLVGMITETDVLRWVAGFEPGSG